MVSNKPALWKYLEGASFVREWEPGKRFIAFNLSRNSNGHTIYGDVPPSSRTRLFAAHNRAIVPYDEQFAAHRSVFFPGDYRNTHRILTHFYRWAIVYLSDSLHRLIAYLLLFYSYIFFAQPKVDQLYKRLVRDRLHYRDDIFCAAGGVIKRLHEDAAALTGKPVQYSKFYNRKTAGGMMNNVDKDNFATYHAFHIRRGDFQYKDMRVDAETIYGNTRFLLNRSVTSLIYIATDEQNKTFFEPFTRDFKVVFLNDYATALASAAGGKLNNNMIGMIEQVICANAHTFIGSPLSTFTGYITR